jgi:hypothetical protein
MGACACGQRFFSPAETAWKFNVSPDRIWAILGRRPWRLQAFRVGGSWLIPEQGVEGFSRQPRGVHLPEPEEDHPHRDGVCPGCGKALFSAPQAAWILNIAPVRARSTRLLGTFRVGNRWLVPFSGVIAQLREQRSKGDEDLETKDDEQLYAEAFAAAMERAEQEAREEAQRRSPPPEEEILFDIADLPPCLCPAYPFPHRRGSGSCNMPRTLRVAYKPDEGIQVSWA